MDKTGSAIFFEENYDCDDVELMNSNKNSNNDLDNE